MSNVPQLQFTPDGVVVPDQAAILAGVSKDFSDAFGGNINPDKRTPQGQLASSETAIIADKDAQIVAVINQMDPDRNDGVYQDVIGRIYYMERNPGVPTNVACQCVGAFQTPIPAGSLAQDSSGNRYVCTDGGVIPISGSITLNFANLVDGPIACPANTLTTISKAIPGWDSINNAANGIPGRLVENRAEFEFRRKNSVAANAHGSKEAIYAAVFGVANVSDVFVTENRGNTPLLYGPTNYSLLPHSVYVAVVGGVGQDIGNAIAAKKDLGCDMNGNTTVQVPDLSYKPPEPEYDITFNRPAALAIKFIVNLALNDGLPADIVDQTKAAIIASFNGADGSQRVRIGGVILASKFYQGVSAIGPGVLILSIKIGTGVANLDRIDVGIDQAPTVDPADITVNLVP